jgi:hypothetical protein
MQKHDRTMSFFLRETRVFLPNRVILGSFLTVWIFNYLQVVVHQLLASIEKTALFQEKTVQLHRKWIRHGFEVFCHVEKERQKDGGRKIRTGNFSDPVFLSIGRLQAGRL